MKKNEEENPLVLQVADMLSAAGMEYGARDFISKITIYGAELAIAAAIFLYNTSPLIMAAGAICTFAVFAFGIYLTLYVAANTRIDQMEVALPEFLSVMASNIRSGHTYDRALLISARKEFGPLSDEIDRVGKETITGKPLAEALSDMAARVPSPSFQKTIYLVVKGLTSGGKLADLLEQTSLDLHRFDTMRKEVASTVLTYQLFSLAAVCFGAPLLYAITTFLVKVFAVTKDKISLATSTQSAGMLPFFQGTVASPESTYVFSIAAIIVTAFFGAMVSGVIGRGEEKSGLPLFPAILAVALVVYFVVNSALQILLGSMFFGTA
jgi:flagellar protein FlaJ